MLLSPLLHSLFAQIIARPIPTNLKRIADDQKSVALELHRDGMLRDGDFPIRLPNAGAF